MENKYILAFIPKFREDQQKIIDYAAKHRSIAGQYMLSEHSLPHITIHQFHADELQLKKIINLVEASNLLKWINLSFESISCISFDNITFWASLMPNHRDTFISLHSDFAELLNFPIKHTYDPHMTLFNSLDSSYEVLVNSIKSQHLTISADFVLALGICDAYGQFTRVLYIFN